MIKTSIPLLSALLVCVCVSSSNDEILIRNERTFRRVVFVVRPATLITNEPFVVLCLYCGVVFFFVLSLSAWLAFLLPFIHHSSIYFIHRVDFIGLFWLECSLLCMFVVGWLVPWLVGWCRG